MIWSLDFQNKQYLESGDGGNYLQTQVVALRFRKRTKLGMAVDSPIWRI